MKRKTKAWTDRKYVVSESRVISLMHEAFREGYVTAVLAQKDPSIPVPFGAEDEEELRIWIHDQAKMLRRRLRNQVIDQEKNEVSDIAQVRNV